MTEKEYIIESKGSSGIYVPEHTWSKPMIPMSSNANIEDKVVDISDGYGRTLITYHDKIPSETNKKVISPGDFYNSLDLTDLQFGIFMNNLNAAKRVIDEHIELYHVRAKKSHKKTEDIDSKKRYLGEEIKKAVYEENYRKAEELKIKRSNLSQKREMSRNKDTEFAMSKDLFDKTRDSLVDLF